MQLKLSTAFISLVAFAASGGNALICNEALRFGNATVTPANPNVGSTINILVDFRCAVQHSGNVPQFVDYTLEVLPADNNGFESPIILARHTLAAGALSDTLTATIPNALTPGAPYNLAITNVHSVNDKDGKPFLTSGGFIPIEPIVASS
ncbi:hypothetical protein D9613_011220 [Agrocybe pediades]|uniref:Uncharacterized protein n=1 Tax=Agrocybe pediades TaxID=84607 RepID=A0A8H4QSJ4_9AGAR|nr:hypothetical protein D9613_011220 [Agrocybe pediades]